MLAPFGEFPSEKEMQVSGYFWLTLTHFNHLHNISKYPQGQPISKLTISGCSWYTSNGVMATIAAVVVDPGSSMDSSPKTAFAPISPSLKYSPFAS